ncbi:hypothetical protein E6P97_00130 [Patescibacteria group bacterium]|nr:MAG: hypothetical protein E6P97_00130 [Patescibacteria group bacterium]
MAIFSSIERVDLSKSIIVRHTSGALTALLRDRIFIDVHEAVRHRKTALSDAGALTDTIISGIIAVSDAGETNTQHIKEIIAQTLAAFDHVAATHYTAFYPVTRRKP